MSLPQEPAPELSLPQIKPYVRKRLRDTSDETHSESSKVSVSSSDLIEGESRGREGGKVVTVMDLDSVTVSTEVKPYVRKRKLKPK